MTIMKGEFDEKKLKQHVQNMLNLEKEILLLARDSAQKRRMSEDFVRMKESISMFTKQMRSTQKKVLIVYLIAFLISLLVTSILPLYKDSFKSQGEMFAIVRNILALTIIIFVIYKFFECLRAYKFIENYFHPGLFYFPKRTSAKIDEIFVENERKIAEYSINQQSIP